MEEVLKIIEEYKEVGNTEDLVLDDVKMGHITPEVKHQLERISDLLYLSMNACDLKSLNHFPVVKTLVQLDLCDNEFPAKELIHLKDLSQLKSLDLDGNKIEKVEQLEPLKELKHLERLELGDTPLSENDDYREKVFKLLPQLKVVSGQDKDGNEVDGSDDEEFSDEEDMSDEEDDEEDDEEEDDEEDDEDDEDEDEEEDDEEN